LQWVEVAWVDADHNAGWVKNKQVDDEEDLGYACGLLVRKKRNFVTIAHQHNRGSGDWRGILRIPTGMVCNIHVNGTHSL